MGKRWKPPPGQVLVELGFALDSAPSGPPSVLALLIRTKDDGPAWLAYRVGPSQRSFQHYAATVCALCAFARDQARDSNEAAAADDCAKPLCLPDGELLPSHWASYLYYVPRKRESYQQIPPEVRDAVRQVVRSVCKLATHNAFRIAVLVNAARRVHFWSAGDLPALARAATTHAVRIKPEEIPGQELDPATLQSIARQILAAARAATAAVARDDALPAWADTGSALDTYLRSLQNRLSVLGLRGSMHSGKRQALYVPRRLTNFSRDEVEREGAAASSDGLAESDDPPTRGTREAVLFNQVRAKGVGLHACILGHAGAGKSTLLEEIAWQLADAALNAAAEDRGRIPFLVYAKHWTAGTHRTLEQFVSDQVVGVPEQLVRELCTTGRAALLLDGLDEVPAASGRLRHFMEWLDQEVSRSAFNGCALLLATRPWAFDGTLLRHLRVERQELEDLSWSDVQIYIDKYFACQPRRGARLIQQLQHAPAVGRLLGRPLFLMLLCFVYEDGRSSLPSSEADLLERALREFLRRRGIYEDPSLRALGRLAWTCWESALDYVTERHALEAIADLQTTDRVSRRVGQAEHLQATWESLAQQSGVLVGDGRIVRFAEQSYLEFLAGRYLVGQPMERVRPVFGRHAWNPRWTSVLRYLADCLWLENRDLAWSLVGWLLAETQAGHDDLWHSLTLLCGQLLRSSAPLRDPLEHDVAHAVAVKVCDAWHWLVVNTSDPEKRALAAEALLGCAAVVSDTVITRLEPALYDTASAADAADVLAMIGTREARQVLMNAARGGAEAVTRAAAVRGLGHIRGCS